jgi:hypothetical protein
MRDLVLPFLIAGAWLTIMALVIGACRSAARADRPRSAASPARGTASVRRMPARRGGSASLT